MRWRTSSTSEPDVDLAGILVGLDAIVWQADPDERRLTYVNDACLALSGRDAGAWLSAPDFGAAFIDAADRERVVEAIGRAPASGERQELEYRLVAPDGGVAWIMNAFRAVPGAQGRRSVRGVMVDLTSRKNAEQALLQQLRSSEEELPAGCSSGHPGADAGCTTSETSPLPGRERDGGGPLLWLLATTSSSPR